MAGRKRRTTGAVLVLAGLVLAIVGFVASPAAADTATANICNNQSGDASKDCVGDKLHGTASSAFDADGNLVFTIDGADGFGGWREIYICIPGTQKTQSADCQGNSDTVLSPSGGDYAVAGVTNGVAGDKSVTFDCDTDFTATVDDSVVDSLGDTVSWTIHVNTCGGGTDEAFGSTTRGSTPDTPTYAYSCLDATNVTETSATLNGSTTNPDADGATFTLNPGGTVLTDTGASPYSASATNLEKNKKYTYSVTFTDGGVALGTSAACEFATRDSAPPAPPVNNPTSDAAVLGVQVSREAPAAPAVAAAAVAPTQIAATGVSDVSVTLLVAGLSLVGFGSLLVLAARRRLAPVGRHSA